MGHVKNQVNFLTFKMRQKICLSFDERKLSVIHCIHCLTRVRKFKKRTANLPGGTPLLGLYGDVPLDRVWFFGLAVLNRVSRGKQFDLPLS